MYIFYILTCLIKHLKNKYEIKKQYIQDNYLIKFQFYCYYYNFDEEIEEEKN